MAGQGLDALLPTGWGDESERRWETGGVADGLAALAAPDSSGLGSLWSRWDGLMQSMFGDSIVQRTIAARDALRRGDAQAAHEATMPVAQDFASFVGNIKPVGGPIRAYHGSPREIEVTQPYPQSYDAFVGGQKAGNMSVSSSGPFASPTVVEPNFRRQGVATALYDQAEKDMGRRMIPSPLGLSDEAVQFWRSRFAAMPEHEAATLIREAQAVGESMGIGKHSSERLAKAFPSYADAIRKYGIAGLIGAATGTGIGSLDESGL